MADAIDFSKTRRIVLLIDLNPLLESPNPNYITSILTTSKILTSFNSLSSSLFSFKFFFSSLSPLHSATTLHRILPNHPSFSLLFNSPSQTLDSLSHTLNSISHSQFTSSSSTSCLHTATSLIQLAHDYDWDSDFQDLSGKSYPMSLPSNLIILLSPVCTSLAEFMSVDVNNTCVRDYRGMFRECFTAVNDTFNSKDIHFCWVDVRSHAQECEINESDQHSVFIRNEISKFGWGFCSAQFIILGSALVSFGLIYPNIGVSSKLLDSCRLHNRIRGQLKLEILDVTGKPLECKCCDLELLHLKVSSKPRSNGITKTHEVGSSTLNAFLASFNDDIMKLRVTSVQKHTKYDHLENCSFDSILVHSAKSGKKGKEGLDSIFADRVYELLAGEKSELFGKHSVPTWQIFLSFLYKEGYWALLSLSNSKGDLYMGVLKPFTIHSAILLIIDNNQNLIQMPYGTNVLMNEIASQGDIDHQKGVSPLGKYAHVSDGKRRKMKKHTYRDLTWSSFCKAAYGFLDVDLAEVYFAYGIKMSKKLKFLKCWMKEVKNYNISINNMPCQMGPDSNQHKEIDIDKNLAASYQEKDEPLSMQLCSDQSRMQDDDALVSCSENSESFFSNLPKKIQHGVESPGVDLKILAERLVNSSICWLHKKHETMDNLEESCTMQVAEIFKLLLREPQDLKEHKDHSPSSTSEYLVREYELQILLRLEILQSEYAGSIKGFMKIKLVKQICSLLEIIQYLVEGGFHGDLSLYDYVERTIKSRYSENLGDVINKIYDQMDLLPFGEENEDQALMFNSEDSNQSWRGKHERNDMSTSKIIQDSFSVEDESCHLLEKVNMSHQGQTKEDHARMLNEAREKRERARRFVSFTSRMPDLQRVWAPKQSKLVKVKPEPKRKKQMRVGYSSVVCETPLIANKPSSPSRQNCAKSVSKALFQDDRPLCLYHVTQTLCDADLEQSLLRYSKRERDECINMMLVREELCVKILDKCPEIQQLRKIHGRLIVAANLASASHIALKLMKAYSESRQIAVTRQLFDEIPQKDVVFFNVMIRSYVNNKHYERALDMYRSMLKLDIAPDHFTLPQILKACSGSENLWVGLQAHVAVFKKALHSNLYVGNGLITMYGKCNRLLDARQVFDEMLYRDVVSYNSLVAAYAQNQLFRDALEVCRTMMQSCSVKPNAGTMASLSPAVTSSDNLKLMMDMFISYGQDSLVSWNVMIAAYVNNSMPADAVNLYLQMESYRIDPDSVTIASVLPACGDLSALSLGRKIHEYVKRKRLVPNLTLENALIDMYAKCGSLNDARKVFDEMQTRDVVSWTCMVSAYGMTGDGQTAVTMFSDMQHSGLTPDSISFVPVLSACSHAGLLDQGKQIFKLMSDEYNIVPRLEHLACMVDLLGRSGRINEAYEFIKCMKVKPNDRIWGALLSACKVHSNMDIGLVAADHLFESVPEQAGYYVLLSNIYAKAGRWKDVGTIRSMMKVKGVKKEPGVSNVELNNQVHSFLAGDQSHPQSKEIYEELDVIVGKMRELGYVPETDSALHDIEDEDKGNHLAVHSEKLAIVFVIINTEAFTPIRITKNLRVCEDCHTAAKLISKIVERDIILRDTNRFHHFKNGFCSCGDYW
ncbi:hypothetical protein QVD17_32443 [Tagetes erecta]|uniref:DYW domain-containing protein n=1 Tax=Tagetes erecta TaxID=13708 RepID=A0AAD8JVR9_TARER|nr:hypothetical protein QVD17_32443 [Tagetes erecta]